MGERLFTQEHIDAVKDAAFRDTSPAGVLERIPEEADWVLIGESTHGTHEFLDMRSELTKLLIERRGFNAIGSEADFPDAYRVNEFVQHLNDRDHMPEFALGDFQRFPTWMWRNEEVASFLTWLRERNRKLLDDETEMRLRSVGFYGLDIYSLAASSTSVINFLDKVDPAAGKRARERYGCFDKYGADAIRYVFGLAEGHTSCQADAVGQLVEMLIQAGERKHEISGKFSDEEAAFAAVSNARVVKGAEEYYRSMFFAENLTWNIRDKHMAETAVHLSDHLKQRDISRPKVIIWAHNSHVSDARSTCMGRTRGEFNLGQLLREKYGEDKVFIVGQTTHHGTVAAASEWGAPVKTIPVAPAISSSHEALLHAVGLPQFGLVLRGCKLPLEDALEKERDQRSIGVLYRPESERQSHYFQSWMCKQFDMLIYMEETTAIMPLDSGTDLTEDGKEESAAGAGDIHLEGKE